RESQRFSRIASSVVHVVTAVNRSSEQTVRLTARLAGGRPEGLVADQPWGRLAHEKKYPVDGAVIHPGQETPEMVNDTTNEPENAAEKAPKKRGRLLGKVVAEPAADSAEKPKRGLRARKAVTAPKSAAAHVNAEGEPGLPSVDEPAQ